MSLIFVIFIWICTLADGTKLCVLSPIQWIDAMKHCQSLGGSPLSHYYIPKRIISQLNFSAVWTSDYAALKPAIGNIRPYWCQFITIAANGQSGGVQIGNCTTEKHYMCCEPGNIAQYHTAVELTLPTMYRCGMLDVNGVFQFVNDCSRAHYSVCHMDNYSENGFADCIQTKTTPNPDFMLSTTDKQATIDPNNSDERDSKLAIGFGVGVPLLICVLVVTIVLAVHMRRNSQLTGIKNGKANAHTEINATYGVSDNRVELFVWSVDETANIGLYSTIPENISNPADYEDVPPEENCAASFPLDSDVESKTRRKTKKAGSTARDYMQFREPYRTLASNNEVRRVYVTRTDTFEDHDNCNTDAMGDEYDGVHSFAAPSLGTLNVYSHIGHGKNDDHYNVASCAHKQPAGNIDDYDKLK
ncbi:uncharacterized protein LOC127842873 isoform X4 [Dreissena polymorpha]|uniref:uncharacterized protein LOC127842873 isoform X4 n=1 Tax=Dreissena polymorpha TaxID=45954 RepID=UPI0022651111|nr:uncharacterized protein LOC127842873 isoform X4 [Dreissena polymorpha]